MSEQGAEQRHQEAVGSMAEEVARLSEALQDWAGGAQAGDGPQVSDLFGPDIATGAPECKACPLCRVIAAARSLDPSLYVALAQAVSAVASSAARAAAQRGGEPSRPDGAEHQGGPTEKSSGQASEPRGRGRRTVERLDLDEAGDLDDGDLGFDE